MARYSEVALVMKKTDFLELVKFAQEREEKYLYNLLKAADGIHDYPDDNEIVLHWDWYPWYDWYSDIEALNSYIANIPYLLYRIGEEWNDVECIDNEWNGGYPVEFMSKIHIADCETTEVEFTDLVTSFST